MDPGVSILLVEDESAIQDVLLDALEEGGFAVVQAYNAEDAMKVLKDNHQSIRALITDINFPASKLTGWDVARSAREQIPGLPVVYMTGASADEWGSRGVPNSVFIGKPFAPAQVVTAISQLLNAGNTSTPDTVS